MPFHRNARTARQGSGNAWKTAMHPGSHQLFSDSRLMAPTRRMPERKHRFSTSLCCGVIFPLKTAGLTGARTAKKRRFISRPSVQSTAA